MKNLRIAAILLMSGVALTAFGCAANTAGSPNDTTGAASAAAERGVADQAANKEKHQAKLAALFAEADKNVDGKVTLDEAQAAAAARFAKADANGDAELDATERKAMRPEQGEHAKGERGERGEHAKGERGERGEHAKGERGERGEHAKGERGERGEHPARDGAGGAQGADGAHGGGMHGMAKWDTNNDGLLSSAELSAGIAQMFTRVDTNNDGVITLAELQAFHPKHDKHEAR